MALPLEGYRVLDLSAVFPGSLCSRILADLGAEVLKIENPAGDASRIRPPIVKKMGVFFHAMNRNKKSVTLDVRNPRGREILRKLVERADVFVENTRPGSLGKIGLGYEDLVKINPRIVYCAISGFGQDGPYREFPIHDINILALSGIMDLIGEKGRAPAVPDTQLGGAAGAMNAALGILSALLHREKTGKGQYIDVSILDAMIPYMTLAMCQFMHDGKLPRRGETLFGGGYAFWNVYRTKDGGYISLGCWEKKYWENFCRVIDRRDLAREQFSPPPRQDDIIDEVRAVFLKKTRAECIQFLDPNLICYAPVNSLEEAIEDPQIRHRGLWLKDSHPVDGQVPQPGFSLKFNEDQAGLRTPAPSLGEHTHSILSELGIDDNEFQELKGAGII